MATVQYNPNTGAKLSKGQSVTFQGKTYTQGSTAINGTSSSSGGGSSGGGSGGGSFLSTPINIDSNPGQTLQAGQVYTYQGNTYTQPGLPAPVAPTNAAQIVQTPDTKLPTTVPDFGNVSDANAANTGLVSYYDNLIKQNADNEKARVAAEQARAKENQSALSKLMSSITSPSDARANAEAQTGITPANYFAEEKAKIEEIGTLTEEYNSVKAQRDAQIAKTQDVMGSMNFINNQTAQIERNSAPKLNELSSNVNSKAAVLQALQGRFTEAQNYVNQAVQDATADTKYKLDLFTTFYQMNEDSFNRLDKIYTDSYKTSMDLAKSIHDENVAEKTAVGNLIISNSQAGIQITDTLDQAYAKIGIKPQTSSQIIGSAETGYYNVITDSSGKVVSKTSITAGTATGLATSGFSTSKVEADIRQDAVALLESVDLKTLTLDKAYTKLRTLYSPSEATDQALKNLLGITPPVVAPTSTVTNVVKDKNAPVGNTLSMPSGNTAPANAFQQGDGFFTSLYNFLFK